MKRMTREWVRKAEDDFQAAELLAAGGKLLHDQICFHCQQSTEKYLKALLHELGVAFTRPNDKPPQPCDMPANCGIAAETRSGSNRAMDAGNGAEPFSLRTERAGRDKTVETAETHGSSPLWLCRSTPRSYLGVSGRNGPQFRAHVLPRSG